MRNKNNILQKLGTTAAIVGISAFTLTPAIQADDDTKVKVKDDKVKIKDGDEKIKVKGENAEETARAILSAEQQAEFKANLVEGYVIPQDRYVYLDPVPETYSERLDPVPDGMVYRWYDNTVYTVNPETYTVISVQAFD